MEQYEILCAQVFSDSRPSAALYNERLDFIQEICGNLSTSLPHAATAMLIMCGSCASLLSHAASDMDVTLLFEPSARGSAANDEKLLRHFCKGLNKAQSRRAPKPMRAHFIHSRIPIVHVTKGPHECDIVFNKTDNIVKAFLFELYVRLDSRLAPLIHIIKAWARQPHVDLNDASRGTFNSFSITLMIIGYLQSIEPPVLPCIQASQVPMPDGSSFSPNWAWTADMNVNPNLRAPMARHIIEGLQSFGSSNTMTVAELLIGFFRYYSCVFDPSLWAVSVVDGKPRSKSQTPCVQGQRRDIVVQDPIVTQENTCRGINGDVLERLRVQMFIELLRAHEGYYTPLDRPDLNPAVVFSAAKLLQHRALANEFVESCRMTIIRSTAPPPAHNEDSHAGSRGEQRSVADRGMHREQLAQQQADFTSSKQDQTSRWSDAESALLW
jgi:DNA polymerase sigma